MQTNRLVDKIKNKPLFYDLALALFSLFRKRGLHPTKCSRKMLQYLFYFLYKRKSTNFFYFSKMARNEKRKKETTEFIHA